MTEALLSGTKHEIPENARMLSSHCRTLIPYLFHEPFPWSSVGGTRSPPRSEEGLRDHKFLRALRPLALLFTSSTDDGIKVGSSFLILQNRVEKMYSSP